MVGKKQSPQKSLRIATSALGLAAGAVGWSDLAKAVTDETVFQTMLQPEHYELMDDGLVVFELETGEMLTLSKNQYLILQGGLLLITDEIAQASISSLPVIGAVRAHVLSDLGQDFALDGPLVTDTQAQDPSIPEHESPRLTEQVELQRYEVARFGNGSEGQSGTPLGLSLNAAPGLIAVINMLQTQLAPPPEFWTDADIADSASTSITGTNTDSFVGYTAASTSAVADPLSSFGRGNGVNATIDLSAGGNNYVQLGASAAISGGNALYVGADSIDFLTIGSESVQSGGTLTLQMGGGANSLSAGSNFVQSGAKLNYAGGNDTDIVTLAGESFSSGGSATFRMENGINSISVGDESIQSGARLNYIGGVDSDTIIVGDNSFDTGGKGTFVMKGGVSSLTVGANALKQSGTLEYHGSLDVDVLSFGDNLATAQSGTAEIKLGGGDNAADIVTFAGAVGTGLNSTVSIQHFNFSDDRIYVEGGISATVGEISDAGGNLTWTDGAGNHTLTFIGIGTGGTGELATSAQLAAAII